VKFILACGASADQREVATPPHSGAPEGLPLGRALRSDGAARLTQSGGSANIVTLEVSE
jgi:hypothetical protein